MPQRLVSFGFIILIKIRAMRYFDAFLQDLHTNK